MKKLITLITALVLAGFIAGCGGGGGGGSSAQISDKGSFSGQTSSGDQASSTPAATTSNADSMTITEADRALNITYKSEATGEWPPAPPVSNAPDARDATN